MIASGHIPRVHRLLGQAIKDGAGITAIVAKLEDSLTRTHQARRSYQARGYDEEDFNISLLVLRLGGRKLLYALSRYIAIPSIRALQRARISTRIMPSFGTPKLDDILFNIRSVLLPRAAHLDEASPFHSGMSIMWDEVNEEDVACYFPHADCVGGLCREHSDSVNLRLSTFDSAVAIARGLAEGTVHYGKEASVIAVGSFGKALRGAFPIVVSPTCKRETPSESAELLTKVISGWQEAGEKYFGPIWSFASDGDAGRRAMVYQLFMKHDIDVKHKLYKYLGGLRGLNLCVGDHDITGDFDWKHEIKRKCNIMKGSCSI
ncbi:hypothetical protein BV22DRAFT_1011518 [Leucogyrophana mollusca]|uniref:Uncharacterized protein n=1 Tax=Leucogyrophana mollusca TaxID=85980 RepID=A0ACB8BHV0_9AGAM|nr:hypothetical protein BV22DRAFT_1011518 [Leucogyrophana mollusca]